MGGLWRKLGKQMLTAFEKEFIVSCSKLIWGDVERICLKCIAQLTRLFLHSMFTRGWNRHILLPRLHCCQTHRHAHRLRKCVQPIPQPNGFDRLYILLIKQDVFLRLCHADNLQDMYRVVNPSSTSFINNLTPNNRHHHFDVLDLFVITPKVIPIQHRQVCQKSRLQWPFMVFLAG